MRVKLILPISFLMLLAIPMLASSDEIQKMTVAELVNKCTTADPNSAAFCNGLVNGVLNQLQTNGLIFSVAALGKATIGDEARKVLEFIGLYHATSPMNKPFYEQRIEQLFDNATQAMEQTNWRSETLDSSSVSRPARSRSP